MAAERTQNLQDTFLNFVRKNKVPLTIFLVNGVKLQGVVTWFDNFCVLLRRDGHSQLVYKHAISTIMPGHPIQMFEPGEEGAAEREALSCAFARERWRRVERRRSREDRLREPERSTADADARAGDRPLSDERRQPRRRRRAAPLAPKRGSTRPCGLARAIDLDIVRPRRVVVDADPAGDLSRQGQGRGIRGAGRKASAIDLVVMDCALSPVQQRNLEKAFERQGHRPHRPDPRNFRRAGAHPRRRAAGRTRPSRLSEIAAGALLDPSRAPARRFRLSRRPRRNPDRDRPPPDPGADDAHRARPRRRQEDARPASREPQRRSFSGRRAGRLHQCRQIDPVQPPDRAPTSRAEDMLFATLDPTLRGMQLPHGGTASCCPTRWASSPICRPCWSRPSARRSKR